MFEHIRNPVIAGWFALLVSAIVLVATIFSIQPAENICADLGIMDLKGNWVVEPRCKYICHVRSTNNYWITDGKLIGPESFSIFGRRFCLPVRYKWQLMDGSGNTLALPEVRNWESSRFGSPPILQRYYHFDHGDMDESGFPLLDAVGCECQNLGENRWMVQRDGTTPFSALEEFVNSFYMVFRNDAPAIPQELYDSTGRKICDLPGHCFDREQFSDGLLTVASTDSHDKDNVHPVGAIDTNGKLVIPMKYWCLGSFSEGVASANFIGSQLGGYIDKSDKFVIPPTRYSGGPFQKNVAFVANAKYKYGAINKHNKVLIPFNYDDLDWMTNGSIKAHRGPRYDIYNTNGELLDSYIGHEDQKISLPSGNQIWFTGKHYCLIDASGKVISPRFDGAGQVTKHLIEVTVCKPEKYHVGSAVRTRTQTSYGLINDQGKWVLPATFRVLFFCGPDRFIAANWN